MNTVQIIVLILSLVVTGLLITVRPVSNTVEKNSALVTELSPLHKDYHVTRNSLPPKVVTALDLDDYIFQDYTKDSATVSLYVGYYFSGKKIGAAHDPQVCYPGQGWKLSNKKQERARLKGGEEISYSSIIAELDEKNELIFYWFQVDDKTTDNTFMQKLLLFQKKILHQGENSAFVRISTSLNDVSPEEAKKNLLNFIEDFYPLFMGYVDHD